MLCCAAALTLTACSLDGDETNCGGVSDGNSIILDISSGSLPVSRADVTPTATEVKLDHIDVLIFDDTTDALEWHERVTMTETNGASGKITLTRKRDEFTQGAAYRVYLIANSTHTADEFAALGSRSALMAMTQSDRYIHVTGLPGAEDYVPQTFLMDGAAYLGDTEPSASVPVVLNSEQNADTELHVTLRRAAAKIVVYMSKGDNVTFDNSDDASGAGYYLSNTPYTTTVSAEAEQIEAELRTPALNSASYFSWSADRIVVTAYAYAHTWANTSMEKETRLVVNIPLRYSDPEDTSGATPELRKSNWYQIPVSEQKVLDRNTCYEVAVTINMPGAENPTTPVELTDVAYEVADWDETTIDIGGTTEHPAYLMVNEDIIQMRNVAEDNTSLIFASSSSVSVTVEDVYYYDKFGNETHLTSAEINTLGITVTPDASLNGNIDINSPVPTNNTIRYIRLRVTNTDGTERIVLVEQYPLEYITNIQGYYSYRDDFGGTTFKSYGSNGTTNNDIFKSKWASKITSGANEGQSIIYRYLWWERTLYETYETLYNPGNARMYKVVLSSTSAKYTLGKPEIDTSTGYVKTDAANNKLVSPSFMIASQLGALSNTVSNYETAAEHCAQYVEYDTDNNKYDDWRLPTRSELEIIINYQYASDVMDEVIRRRGYWCADKNYVYNEQGQSGNGYVRCVRDAYDTTSSNN